MELIDREQKRVDRDVVDVLELVFQPMAERTVGVGENHELARAITLDARERKLERQLVEGDSIKLARLRFRQVLLGRDIVDRPDDDLVRLGVGVDHLIIEHRFVQPEIGTLRDVAHVGAREPLLERFLERRNVACHRRCGGWRLR